MKQQLLCAPVVEVGDVQFAFEDTTSFGRITSTVIPNRVIVLTGRISF